MTSKSSFVFLIILILIDSSKSFAPHLAFCKLKSLPEVVRTPNSDYERSLSTVLYSEVEQEPEANEYGILGEYNYNIKL
jgi:hypothetical protein